MTEPDDQYRGDAVKALHLLLHDRWDLAGMGPLNDDALREKAEVWVDAAVGTMTVDMVMLTVGSDMAAETLARAVRQCDGPDTEPTPQDITEAHKVIERIANPPHES
jgi:hypothetical protein